MMIFMLIAVVFMLRVERTTTLVVKEYQETKNNLYLALQKEFAQNLKQWDAEILGDMTIRFDDQNVMFDTGSSALKPEFEAMLDDFIPRYLALITSPQYKSSVKEIRIEGYASKKWANSTDEKTAFVDNMRLSQERAQSTLVYILSNPAIDRYEPWMQDHLTATGFSSSHPIYQMNNIVDDNKSQRVEFKIITNADEKMEDIAQRIKEK